MKYTALGNNKKYSVYDLEGFSPLIIDEIFLRDLGIQNFDTNTAKDLKQGSLRFQRLFSRRQLIAPLNYSLEDTDVHAVLKVHDYTRMCPKNVLEVNPSVSSCSISCLYCLVDDGNQAEPIIIFKNYPELVRRNLERFKDKDVFFYFSPKTEAFSEPLLETGISHQILREFIRHYEKNPDSRARLFIASKAGPRHLNFENNGDSVLTLLASLKGKIQFNGSIGVMPRFLQDILEPNAPYLESRLEAMEMCQDKGIYAKSILSQPIVPNYLEGLIEDYLDKLKGSGIINIKPEFLTVDMQNIALISQYINHFDRTSLRNFLSLYVSTENKDHVKQRCRTAPDRNFSLQCLKLLYPRAAERGISISICNWVKSQLPEQEMQRIEEESKKRGFRCLGYQENLLRELKNDKCDI